MLSTLKSKLGEGGLKQRRLLIRVALDNDGNEDAGLRASEDVIRSTLFLSSGPCRVKPATVVCITY